jgi:Family of unknown function (DUF6221)
MSDLTEFLTARLDEDEADAHHAARNVVLDASFLDDNAGDRALAHWLRHDPARVLREVEAKRKILAMWQEPETERYLPTGEVVAQVAVADAIDSVVRELNTVYSDHPDYDEAWRPE